MLKNAYLLAKIGADTAENEQHFAEFLPNTGNYHPPAQHPAAPTQGSTGAISTAQVLQHRLHHRGRAEDHRAPHKLLHRQLEPF